jgi:hypothetical protein
MLENLSWFHYTEDANFFRTARTECRPLLVSTTQKSTDKRTGDLPTAQVRGSLQGTHWSSVSQNNPGDENEAKKSQKASERGSLLGPSGKRPLPDSKLSMEEKASSRISELKTLGRSSSKRLLLGSKRMRLFLRLSKSLPNSHEESITETALQNHHAEQSSNKRNTPQESGEFSPKLPNDAAYSESLRSTEKLSSLSHVESVVMPSDPPKKSSNADEGYERIDPVDSATGNSGSAAVILEPKYVSDSSINHQKEATDEKVNEMNTSPTISMHIFSDGYSLTESGYPRYSFGNESKQILFCFDQGLLPPNLDIRGARRLDVQDGKQVAVLFDHTRPETREFRTTMRMDYLNICLALAESPYVRETRQAHRALQLEAGILRKLHQLTDLVPNVNPHALSSHLKPSQAMNFARAYRINEEITYTRRLPILDLFLKRRNDRHPRFRRNTNPRLASQSLFLVAGNERFNLYRRMRAQAESTLNDRFPPGVSSRTSADDHEGQILRKPVFMNPGGRLLRQIRFVLQRASTGVARLQPNPPQFSAASMATETQIQEFSSADSVEKNLRSTSKSLDPRTVCLLDIIVKPQKGCECVIRRGQEKSRDLDILRIQIGSERSAHAFANQFRRLMRGEGFICEQDVTLPNEGRLTGTRNGQDQPEFGNNSVRLEDSSARPL